MPEVRTNVPRGPTTGQVARIVLVVVGVAVALLLIYALRQPLT